MNFCTLFDSFYMLKGLALYKSLELQTDNFHLYVMAFDRECYRKLLSLGLRHLTVELLDDFETQELLSVKPTRTKAEYCWTCGPSVIWHFMKKYELPDIAYLDSDLFFLGAPQIIYDEIGDKSVAITEQGISEKMAKLYGRYCVQYMYFRNNEEGCKTLEWWKDACIEWCFAKFEGEKYADQKYLDKFPQITSSLCVLKNLGAGIAPWNMQRYKYTKRNSFIYKGNEYPFVFYHMHGIIIDIHGNNLYMRSKSARINEIKKACFFIPYANTIIELLNNFFGKNITSYEIKGINSLKSLEFLFHDLLRGNKFVIWLKYKVLKPSYKGHGVNI